MEKKRQVEFDYTKTIAVFFMVIIHVIEPGLEMSVVSGIVIAAVSILITRLLPRIKW